MAYNITIPVHLARVRLQSGGVYIFPVNDAAAFQYTENTEAVARDYVARLQKSKLDKGIYTVLLDEVNTEKFEKDIVTVTFSEAKQNLFFSEFTVEFEYFYCKHGKGKMIIIPALGMESYATQSEAPLKAAEELVRLEFSLKRRLNSLTSIIEAMGYQEVEVVREEVQISIPSLAEAEQNQYEASEKLLSLVAKKLVVNTPSLFKYEAYFKQLKDALQSDFGKSVLLIGNNGIGKTTLFKEYVHQKEKIGFEREIWETNASFLIKELTRDTGWQDGLAKLIKELSDSGDYLFVHNLADLFEVGKYEGNALSMAEYMRDYIGRGEVVLLAECTAHEAAQIELRAPGFLALFNIIRINEPRGNNLHSIISEKVKSISKARKIDLKSNGVDEIIRLHQRFMPYSGFPGKPIRFIESVVLGRHLKNQAPIGQTEIIKFFAEESGMPLFMIDPAMTMDMDEIKEKFNREVYGQKAAVAEIANMLATVKTGLSRSNKPIASFLFVGPTGVGKTELAKVLAEFMFSSRQRLTRFDMSEYSNPYDLFRLVGLLTSAVRQQPFSVILFDEIEKAASNFYDLLLQLLSEGRLSDGRGKVVNFCSCIIIMTSNVGATDLQTQRIGWSRNRGEEEVTSHFITAVEKYFRPELFNRIDRIVPFAPLAADTVRTIIEREFALLRQREGLQYRNIEFTISDAAKHFLATEGYDAKYGARYLQRTIRRLLITPLAQRLNAYPWEDKLVVTCDVLDNQLLIDISDDPLGLDLLLEELEKVNNADLVAELRRSMDMLLGGLSWKNFLDNEKNFETRYRLKRTSDVAGYYRSASGVIKDIKELENSIVTAEQELGLVNLGLGPYRTAVNDEISDWQDKFLAAKISMVAMLNNFLNHCIFKIYGRGEQIEQTYKEYQKVFKELDVRVKKARLVIFDPQLYNEQVSDPNGTKRRRAEYAYHYFSGEFSAKGFRKSDVYGLEMELTGTLVFLLLQKEAGLLIRKVEEEEKRLRFECERGLSYSTPLNIHRKDFYRGNSRRDISIDLFKDKEYDFVAAREDYPQMLAQYLLKQLPSLVEEVLLYFWRLPK